MTRKSLNWRLFIVSALIITLISLAYLAKLSAMPGLAEFYDFIRDMSLLIATVMASYLAHVFQRRASFLQSLREEWREIVVAKSDLVAYCDLQEPVATDYTQAYQGLSRCIDHMRIVYRNVGETGALVGYYPYEPLHDMRRAMEQIDPRRGHAVTHHDKVEARKKIVNGFNALREHFLDEFDLNAPTRPILGAGARREKKEGGRLPVMVMAKLRANGRKL